MRPKGTRQLSRNFHVGNPVKECQFYRLALLGHEGADGPANRLPLLRVDGLLDGTRARRRRRRRIERWPIAAAVTVRRQLHPPPLGAAAQLVQGTALGQVEQVTEM